MVFDLKQAKERVENIRYKVGKAWHPDEEKRLNNHVEMFFLKKAKPLLKDGKFKELEQEIEEEVKKIRQGESDGYDTINPLQNSPRIKDLVEEEFKEELYYEAAEWFLEYIEEFDKEIIQGNTEYHGKRRNPYDSAKGPKFRLPDFNDGRVRFVNEKYIKSLLSRTEDEINKLEGTLKIGEDIEVPTDEEKPLKHELEVMEERHKILKEIISAVENEDLEQAKKEYEEFIKLVKNEERKFEENQNNS